MDRRSMLKALVAAPAAAKHFGGQIAAGLTSTGLSAGALAQGSLPHSYSLGSAPTSDFLKEKDWLSEQVAWTESYLAKLISRSLDDEEAQGIARHAREIAMQKLDPDLYAARSMSLAVKIHVQTQRNIDAHYRTAIAHQKQSLASWVKHLAGLGK